MPSKRNYTSKKTKISKNNHTKTIKKHKCSPSLKYNRYSCYSDEALKKLKNLWNLKHPSDPITVSRPYSIWKELKQRFSSSCDNERCWLRQSVIKSGAGKDILEYTFAPKAPDSWKININEWLSSADITSVMKHFEYRYKCFGFIGPSPIDFDTITFDNTCVWDELCNFNLETHIKKGKTKIGFIFNTDPHTKSGEHWVSMFLNIKATKPYIFYFDSTGDPIINEVKALVERITGQAKNLGINLKFYQNSFKHQKLNTECGMYSLFFIIQQLTENKSIKSFLNERISDKEMEQFRQIYFNIT